MKILRSYKTAVFLIVLVFFAFATLANAQGTRKKSRTTSKAVPLQTLPAPTTEPVIISRAEDYPIGDVVLSPAIENALRSSDQVENPDEKTITELTGRIKALETAQKDDYDVKQKRLAMNLEILIKAEQRAESLRKQSFDLLEKENGIKTKLEQIENDLRPESIERSLAFVGSLRPEELRSARKKSLEAERSNLQTLLVEIQRTRTSVETNVVKADQLVDRIRVKLEADIDTSLDDKPTKP